MIPEIVLLWDKHKEELKKYFSETPQSEYCNSYEDILKKLFEYVINKSETVYDIDKITVIDNGDYHGTIIFAIPKDTYQPRDYEYLFTSVGYGSCSGCDTLKGISNYEDGIATENQVSEYMTLSLHLIQKIKKLYDND
jgi:hypothetical protein